MDNKKKHPHQHEPKKDEAAPQDTVEIAAPACDAERIKELEEALAAKGMESAANWDKFLRERADLENYRKRMIREKEEAIRYANAGLLEKILPILDNFELGLDAARGDAAAKGIVDGFAMVHRQLGDFLQSSGLQIIDAVGQPFDPKLHEALGHESDPSQADGTVIRQLRRGYRLSDRLVRPASVIVNKGA